MAHDLSGPQFPNQKFGWVLEDDGTWSLYSPDGTLVIASRNNRAQVSDPTSDFEIANRKYVLANAGTVGVTDGSTTVSPATSVDFTSGATVTDGGGGVAQVAVSGGSQPDIKVFPFAFDTPGLAEGVVAYTPNADGQDYLLDAWFEVSTAWDGTTPKGDLGTFVGTTSGALSANGGLWDMTSASIQAGTGGPGYGGDGMIVSNGFPSLLEIVTNKLFYTLVPARLSPATALKVVVSQDGTAGGADPGATHGAGTLCLRIGRGA